MDKQTLVLFLNIIIALPLILTLIVLVVKYGGSKMQNMQNGRFIKIIERVPLTKETSILVVKIGNEGYVMSSSSSKTEIILKLNEDQLIMIEDSKKIPQYSNINDFINKLKAKREDKND